MGTVLDFGYIPELYEMATIPLQLGDTTLQCLDQDVYTQVSGPGQCHKQPLSYSLKNVWDVVASGNTHICNVWAKQVQRSTSNDDS